MVILSTVTSNTRAALPTISAEEINVRDSRTLNSTKQEKSISKNIWIDEQIKSLLVK